MIRIAKDLRLLAKELIGSMANDIRKDLKQLGLGRRDVSVRTQNGGTSEAIFIQFKTLSRDDLDKDMKKGLQKILKEYQTSYEDSHDAKGEVLQGGDTFIFMDDKDGRNMSKVLS